MSHRNRAVFLTILGLACWGCWAQEAASDPWNSGELLQPADLAKAIQSDKAPIILSVAFPVLYKGKHIVHAIMPARRRSRRAWKR